MNKYFSKVTSLLLAGVMVFAAGCTDLETDINNLDGDITKVEGTIASLTDQIKALQAADETLKAAIAEAQEKAEALYATKAELSGLQTAIEDEINALQGKDTELAGTLGDHAKSISDLQSKVGALETTVAGLEAFKNEATKTLADLKTNLEKAIADGDKANADAIAALQTKLEGELALLSSTVAGQIAGLEARIAANEAAIKDIKETLIPEIEDRVNGLDVLISSIQNVNGDQDAAIEALQAFKEATEDTLELLTAAIQRLDQTMATKKDVETLKNSIDELLKGYVTTEDLTSELAILKANLEAQLTDLYGRKVEIEDYLTDQGLVKARLVALEDAIEAINKSIEEHKLAFEQYKKDVEEAISDAVSAAVENLASTEYVDNAIKELTDKGLATTEEVTAAVNAAKAALQSQIDTINGTLSDLQSRINRLEIAVDGLRGDVDALLKQIQSVVYVPETVAGMIPASSYVLYFAPESSDIEALNGSDMVEDDMGIEPDNGAGMVDDDMGFDPDNGSSDLDDNMEVSPQNFLIKTDILATATFEVTPKEIADQLFAEANRENIDVFFNAVSVRTKAAAEAERIEARVISAENGRVEVQALIVEGTEAYKLLMAQSKLGENKEHTISLALNIADPESSTSVTAAYVPVDNGDVNTDVAGMLGFYVNDEDGKPVKVTEAEYYEVEYINGTPTVLFPDYYLGVAFNGEVVSLQEFGEFIGMPELNEAYLPSTTVLDAEGEDAEANPFQVVGEGLDITTAVVGKDPKYVGYTANTTLGLTINEAVIVKANDAPLTLAAATVEIVRPKYDIVLMPVNGSAVYNTVPWSYNYPKYPATYYVAANYSDGFNVKNDELALINPFKDDFYSLSWEQDTEETIKLPARAEFPVYTVVEGKDVLVEDAYVIVEIVSSATAFVREIHIPYATTAKAYKAMGNLYNNTSKSIYTIGFDINVSEKPSDLELTIPAFKMDYVGARQVKEFNDVISQIFAEAGHKSYYGDLMKKEDYLKIMVEAFRAVTPTNKYDDVENNPCLNFDPQYNTKEKSYVTVVTGFNKPANTPMNLVKVYNVYGVNYIIKSQVTLTTEDYTINPYRVLVNDNNEVNVDAVIDPATGQISLPNVDLKQYVTYNDKVKALLGTELEIQYLPATVTEGTGAAAVTKPVVTIDENFVVKDWTIKDRTRYEFTFNLIHKELKEADNKTAKKLDDFKVTVVINPTEFVEFTAPTTVYEQYVHASSSTDKPETITNIVGAFKLENKIDKNVKLLNANASDLTNLLAVKEGKAYMGLEAKIDATLNTAKTKPEHITARILNNENTPLVVKLSGENLPDGYVAPEIWDIVVNVDLGYVRVEENANTGNLADPIEVKVPVILTHDYCNEAEGHSATATVMFVNELPKATTAK